MILVKHFTFFNLPHMRDYFCLINMMAWLYPPTTRARALLEQGFTCSSQQHLSHAAPTAQPELRGSPRWT